MSYRRIPKEEIAKIKKYWKQSSNNKDKFRELILGDKTLKGTWASYDVWATRCIAGYAGYRAAKYKFMQLKPEELDRLTKLIKEQGTAAAIREFPQFKTGQLRSFAKNRGISVKRVFRPHKKAKSYDSQLMELILSGKLVSSGLNGLLAIIKKEFQEEAKSLNLKTFEEKVSSLIWTKPVEDALRQIVGYGLPIDRFSKHYPYIPDSMIKNKVKELTGTSRVHHPATFLKGMGRIGDLRGLNENFEFPRATLHNPFMALGSRVRVINGVNLGLPYQKIIEDNTIRRALADANMRGIDVVVIANPFDIDSKKAAGGLKVQRAFASGLNTNIKLLDPYYQMRLRQDDAKDRNEPKLKYETIAERFLNTISGWAKIATHPDNNNPEFKGQVLIVLGYKEEDIITNAAAWELGYWTKLKQAQIEAEIKAVKAAFAQGRSDKDRLNEELANLTALKARIIQSNISVEDLQKYARKVMHFVVQKLEEAIPNSKVIGQGSCHIKVGDETIELNIPSHMRVSTGLLRDYVSTYGARAVRNEVAKTAVICHPYALNYRMTAREINVGDKRAEARIFVAPIAVDGKFIREAQRDAVRGPHPISKVVFSSQFSSGVLDLHLYNGMVSADSRPLESLSRKSKPSSDKDLGKYIWIFVGTDPHYGSRNREEVWSEACKGSLGVSDAVIQMMRDANLFKNTNSRVHIYTVNDDPTQGNHFDTHKQPHPRQMSYQDLERMLQKMKPEDAVKAALEQIRLRGADWLQEQVVQVKQRHIEPNLDFFASVLKRVEKSGIIIKGISDIHKVKFDSRDMGAINWGTGNHFEATVDRVLTEGFIYSDYLRALLSGTPEWQDKQELLKKLIAAPLEGNQYFAWGTLKYPGGYEWAVEFRSDPPRLSSWADPLLGAVNNDAIRGDYGLFMTGHKTVKIYGDKHFYAAVNTEHAFYHMCAAGTSTDLYGHRGFPPNNTGASFVGLPANGPESGPILLRTLHIEHIRRYFDKPYKFDWESFLPNPV